MADWGISSETIDALFSSTSANTQARMDSFAATVLGSGIDYFQDGKYDLAINAFKRTAALSPFSDNSAKAYDYIGKAYLKQEKTDQAVKTYKDAVRIYPNRAEFHIALGDIYLKQENHAEALKEYEQAVRLDPTNTENLYSLGQAYIDSGELDKAREQFSKVVQLSPISAAGFYGLGQVARLEGNLNDAEYQLTRAIRVNKGFELAYLELGYVYADQGDFQKAEDQSAILESKKSSKYETLDAYIAKAKSPRLLMAMPTNGFNTGLGPNTQVSSLAPILENADKSKLFSVKFAFSKDMDESSIINTSNWNISRANIRENGGVYNYGLTPSASEAVIGPSPAYVTWDTETNTATVYFWLSQNATSDATIDPRHIVFQFSGVDAYGKAMDATADQYSGFSGVA